MTTQADLKPVRVSIMNAVHDLAVLVAGHSRCYRICYPTACGRMGQSGEGRGLGRLKTLRLRTHRVVTDCRCRSPRYSCLGSIGAGCFRHC